MRNNKGFTLIELLFAIAIAGIVLAAVYGTFMVQNKSFKRQEQIVQLQDNLRSAMTFMTREIRMARSNPTSNNDGSIGILEADAGTFHFTMDISGGETDDNDNDGDGLIDEADEAAFSDGDVDDANEDITYTLYDPLFDDPVHDTAISRISGATGTNQALAENIDALNFVYLNGDGNPMVTPVSIPQLQDISAVQVTIVAKMDREDPSFTDKTIYRNQQNTVILDKAANPDHFRRRMVSSTIKLRN